MSWMKRAQGGAAPPPGSERQAYAAPQAQPFGNQQNMYSNFQGGTTGSAPPQQFWQMPPQQQQQPQYNQQFGQVYQQQDYPANANQFYQPNPNQFNQTYTNQGNTQQQSYQQNYYQNQGAQQQNFQQNKANADSWEDNWDWGWEESAKQAQKASQHAAQQPNAPQQQVFNNANVIAESFASTDSWNWSMDDKKEPKETPTVPHMNENKEPTLAEPKPAVENNAVPGNNMPVSTSSTLAQPAEEVRTLNDREVVKERLPNLALGKRFHLDNLTPQWSIESQMSQESSDGPHTQSEGTYRSENQSRNSSKSSPGLNTDNSNFNYSQAALDEGYSQNSEWSRPSDEPTLADSIQTNSLQEIHEELSGPMQDMSLNNHENPSKDKLHPMNEVVPRTSQEHLPTQPPAFSPPNFLAPVPSSVHPPPLSTSMPPPPPVSSVPLPVTSSTALSAPPSSSAIPPPNIPPSATNQNPFKMNAGPFSHKTIAKVSTSAPTVQAFPPPMPSTNLTSPAVVSKVSQNNRVPLGFEANLETTPDNSERPDQLQVSAFRPMAVSQQVPDNMEVAPRNDRNEYLQTAHLSSSDYGENTDFSTSAPPPGLRRMVVGQQESEYNQNLNISGDEPPPGLARMVPGQQTEAENAYNQSADNYLDRHIDGQPTDSGARPYRQADGQQTPDNYTQPAPARGAERRPIGLDRMVPGEPSNDDYSQYQGSNYAANEHRVVTGLDHDFSMPSDSGPPDVREQNVDGSDYTEQSARNPQRNIIGARESSNDASPDFNAPPDEQQREVTMEGENLQDLSIISSTELTYSREQVLDGADITLTDIPADRKTDLSDSIDHPTTSSRRQSLNRVNSSGEDSERDRAFKSSPRRDKHKSTRDRDQKRDRDRDRERDRERDKEGRYSRGDRKYEADRRSVRDERRDRDGYARDRRDRDRDDRRDRDDSPDTRRARRAARAHRYETEDTDYYSDRERDRRRHREGSYTSSKPPRPDDKERRYGDERDRSKRYHTIERDRRYDEERSRRSGRRSERHRERYERGERAYRDIDPARLYGLRAKDDPRRGEFSSPSRPDSREAAVTDDDAADARRRGERRARRTAEPFYDEYGAYADPYLAQRQQYAYYEQLRLRDPAAYMLVYKQLLAGRAPPAPPAPYDAFGAELAGAAYEARRDERASLHSGRSSAGLKGNDTDLNTDMSLNLHLEESTVRSERMTPFRYSTAHIKGSVASRDVVVVRAAYPVDGAPATVHVLSLAAALAHLPAAQDFAAFPGPLLKGVTHKKSVIDYCEMRVRNAEKEGARDVTGYVLMWDLLALMLRQNGVVVGTDIAELLMKNVREYEYKVPAAKSRNESRRGSSVSGEGRDGREEELRSSSPDQPSLSMSENLNQESSSSPGQAAAEERAALDRLRDLLLCGNRQDAIEWAVSTRLWGHALQLSAHAPRRVRASVAARFLPRCPRADPLTRCTPRWRARRRRRPRPTAPARRMLLANPTRPSRTGARCWRWATRWRRARPTARSCCYVAAGLPLARHPLAPAVGRRRAPRRAWAAAGRPARRHASTCSRTNKAALRHGGVRVRALAQTRKTLVITELQPYKFVLAAGCLDVGQYERRAGLHGGVRRAPSPARPPPSRPRCLPAGRAGRQAEVPRPGVGRGGRAGGGGQRGGVARHSTGSATSRAPPAKPTSCPYWSLYRAPAVPGWRAGGRGAAEYAPYYPAPAPEDSQPEEWASSRRAVREYEPEPYPYAEFVVFTINFNNSSRSDICFQSQYNISRVSRAIVFVSRPSYPLYAQMRIAGRATVRAVLYELCGAAVQPAPRRARPAPPAARPPAHRAPRPATARVAPHPAPRTSPSCAPPPRPALRRACCSRPALGAEPGRAGPAGPGGRVVAATVERWRGGERAARGYKPLPAPRRAPRPPRPQPAPPAHRAPRRPRARGAPPRAAGRARARALPRPRCAAACCSRPALAPSRGRAGPAGPGGRVVAATVERWRGGERAARGYKRWCSAARTHRRAGGPGRALARPADLRATIERSLDRFEAMLARRPARTFAIDAPTAPGARAPRPRATGTPILADLRATIERSLDRFEAMLARRPARTFAIDAPTAPGAPGPAAPRDWDAKYYVAGPKTYDIDEPVDYM
uniref:Sec16 Sec23-binding domain-containing protein n=1 Tax=Heliothis virescens TaxID=7102 RepID=A0A2A4JWL4_HELVI